jgi:peptidoglycan/xylan/chitin deacetylase (PgdA/CDA1 family)
MHDFLNQTQPYLTSEQIKNLNVQGFTIGAHSIDHPYYYKIPLAEQLRQTRESLNFVSSIINQKLRLFAFPFTDYHVYPDFFEQIKPDVDLCFGTAGLKNDKIPFNLQRFGVENDKFSTLKSVLKKAYLKRIVKMFGIRKILLSGLTSHK